MLGMVALYPLGGTWWYVIRDEVVGNFGDFWVRILSCVCCICRICLSRIVCSSISFCRRFREICLAEFRLLLMAFPLLNRGEHQGNVFGLVGAKFG